MERSEVSRQEVHFYLAASELERWCTAAELATQAKIATRTARAYAVKFVKLGLFDVAEVFPAHRYRWSAFAAKRNAAYLRRLTAAAEVFRETHHEAPTP